MNKEPDRKSSGKGQAARIIASVEIAFIASSHAKPQGLLKGKKETPFLS